MTTLSLARRLRTLVGQSSLYAIAWVASSLTGVLMLPLYTAYLSPADYGIVQILDYTAEVLIVCLVAGQVPAIYRFWAECDDAAGRRRVVATGFTYVAIVGLLVVAMTMPFHGTLSALLLGPDVSPRFILMALAILMCDLFILVPTAYFTVSQQPVVYVSYSLGRLVLGVAGNIYCIAYLNMGAMGMLTGNLVSSAVFAVIMTVHMVAKNGLSPELERLRPMLRFGLPMIPALAASALMQNADRYYLRAYSGLHEVGLYSLGYKLPYFLATVILSSFNMVWSGHMLYSIAKDPGSHWQFGRIATYYMTGFVFLMYTMAVTAPTVMGLVADDAYITAWHIMPVICLGMTFYTFHTFVTVGPILEKRTELLVVAYGVALAVSLSLNSVVVPIYGSMGAAWVAVATYLVFVAVNYLICHRIYPIQFEVGRLVRLAVVGLGLYALCAATRIDGGWAQLAHQTLFVLLFPLALLATGFLVQGEAAAARRMLAPMLRRATG